MFLISSFLDVENSFAALKDSLDLFFLVLFIILLLKLTELIEEFSDFSLIEDSFLSEVSFFE